MANAVNKLTTEANPTFVVLGYGNPQRGDDAIGWHVVSQVQALNLPNVEIQAVKQLTPELSEKLAAADFAFFVDACKFNCGDTVKVKPLDAYGCEPGGSGVPACGHGCDPATLLALTQSVYGRYPQAWWVEVPASHFQPDAGLSDLAKQGIVQALQAIQALIGERLAQLPLPC